MHKYYTDSTSELYVQFFLGAISLLFGFFISMLPIHNPFSWVISAPSALSIFSILNYLFSKIGWKMLSKMISAIPDLNGTYSAKIFSDSESEKFDSEVTLTIRQTWKKISIILTSRYSRSESISAAFYSGGEKLIYNYKNEPLYDSVDTMNIHRGTAEFLIEDKQLKSGNYYNDRHRKTSGVIREIKKI